MNTPHLPSPTPGQTQLEPAAVIASRLGLCSDFYTPQDRPLHKAHRKIETKNGYQVMRTSRSLGASVLAKTLASSKARLGLMLMIYFFFLPTDALTLSSLLGTSVS